MAKNVGVEVKAGADLVNFVPYEHRRFVIPPSSDFQTAVPKGGSWSDEPLQTGPATVYSSLRRKPEPRRRPLVDG